MWTNLMLGSNGQDSNRLTLARLAIVELAKQVPGMLILLAVVFMFIRSNDKLSETTAAAVKQIVATHAEEVQKVETLQAERVRHYTDVLEKMGATIDANQHESVVAAREVAKALGENSRVLGEVTRLLQK